MVSRSGLGSESPALLTVIGRCVSGSRRNGLGSGRTRVRAAAQRPQLGMCGSLSQSDRRQIDLAWRLGAANWAHGCAVLTDEQRNLGRAVLDSIWGSSEWCFRKVESVQLIEGERTRRRVSLDCMPPPDRHLAFEPAERNRWRSPRGPGMVPLGFISKGVVKNLDTTGGDGATLPVLGRDDNGELSLYALAYQYEREVGVISAEEYEHLWAIVFEAPKKAALAASLLFPTTDQESGEIEFHGISGPLIDLARDLAANFLFVVLVPRDLVGTRTVLKYSFDWTAEFGRRPLNSALVAAGYGTQALELGVGDPSWAASYHLEVRVQSPLVARKLSLPPADTSSDAAGSETGWGTLIHASASYPEGPPPTRIAALGVAVEATSIRLVAILVSLFTAVVFQLEQHLPGARDALLAAPDGAVAILLAAPAVAVVLLARVGESHLSASLLRPLRAITLWCAALLALASASLVGQLHEPWISRLWTTGAWSTTFFAVALLVPVVFGRRQML